MILQLQLISSRSYKNHLMFREKIILKLLVILVICILSQSQIKLASLSKLNKPIILILNEGRPRIISDFENKMNAVISVTYLK
jgi:hypothetical protein